jgi:aminoglycoside phosphotransferase (APT) family kinase protein
MEIAGAKTLQLLEMMDEFDLNQHPLHDFFQAVVAEYDRSILMDNACEGDHKPWAEMSDWEQHLAIMREYEEVKKAIYSGDIGGEHGEIREGEHLANVIGKRWNELKRRG